jgi:two-component system LytT family sensor kinase
MIFKQNLNLRYKEIIFQIVLHSLVFVFYAIDKRNPTIQAYQIPFFLNYALAAVIINYLLFPYFFYKKKYLYFALSLISIVASIIFIEEMILEKIYFPDTKGKRFLGVFYTLVDVLPVPSILVGVKFAWDALIKQREVEYLKNAIQESELQFLTSQINPHFLFNNLNNLYSYAIENSPKTPEIIIELSSVLRYMLYECREKYVPLAKEVKHLEHFINLSEMQIEERGEVHFSKENIQTGQRISPLILIVFIENAFKHSTASQSEQIKIDVKVALKEGNILELVCKNSFQPMSNTDNLSKGIGLENVRKRLELIYPNSHELDIQKSDNEYIVNLKLEL